MVRSSTGEHRWASAGFGHMRRLLFLFISLAVVATACSNDGVVEVASLADTATADAQSGADNTEAEVATSAPDTEAVPAAFDAATCGFGAGLSADRIEIEQIPGEGRQNTVSALNSPAHSSFPEPLVDLNRILSGGPPPDGIPPIDNPIFQTASTVDWIECNEPVLSLAVDGETRAYPVQILTWHEIVNDTFDDLAVTVSYCPLCNSALAYKRDLGDRVVTFGTSGRLFNSSLVMYDRETESLWTHFNGTAVVGTLHGTELELLPMQTTSWSSFLQANPDGLVLTRETGHNRRYGQNPYSGYDDVTTSPFLFDGDSDPRLPAKERIVGIRRNDDSAAIVLESLSSVGVLATEVDGDLLSVWHLPGTATALEGSSVAGGRDIGAVGVYLPIVDGQVLNFHRTDDGVFIDAETGSSWNIQGLALDGPLAGQRLEPVEHLDTFWFALAAFEPDTRVVTG
jgi:hypothetical protein